MSASKIDLEDLGKLCELQCTQAEIASFFGCSTQALEERIKKNLSHPVKLDGGETVELSIREIMQRGYDRGKISLRRAQFKSALEGNVTAQIWLGKQVLGQRDNLDSRLTGANDGPIQTQDVNTLDVLLARISELRERRDNPQAPQRIQ